MAKNEIKIAVVVDPSKAASGVKSVTGELGKIDTAAEKAGTGVQGKLGGAFTKAQGAASQGIGGITAGLGGMALPLAAAGAGIVKFGIDSAGKFAELGEKVEKFGTISGTSAEEASRFIAVADDYGVSADTLAGAVGKLGKGLGANVGMLDKYGVSVARAKDGSVDLAQTTFNVIDAYNATADPTKKAALGAQAFGKSYADLIPLIVEGSGKIKKSFDDVDPSQVMGEEQQAMAKAYGLAIDNLKDQLYDFQLTVGKQVIPVLTDLADEVTTVSGAFNKLVDALPGNTGSGVIEWVTGVMNPIKEIFKLPQKLGEVKDAIAELAGGGPAAVEGVTDTVKSGMDNITVATGAAMAAVRNISIEGQGALDGLSVSQSYYGDAVDETAGQIQGWKKKTDAALASAQKGLDETKYKWDVLSGAVSADESWLHLQQSFDDVKAKGVEAGEATETAQKEAGEAATTRGKSHVKAAKEAAAAEQEAENATRATKLEVDSLKSSVIGYGKEILGLPPEKVTKMLAEIDAGNLARVEAQLEILTRNRTINLDIIARGGAGYGGVSGARATGGPVVGKSTYLVGEKGPELFTPSASGMITPVATSSGGGGGGLTLVINNYNAAGVDPVAVGRANVEAIKAYERTSGAGWRS